MAQLVNSLGVETRLASNDSAIVAERLKAPPESLVPKNIGTRQVVARRKANLIHNCGGTCTEQPEPQILDKLRARLARS